MQDFFATILPASGVYFVVTRGERGFIHHPCHSFADMEAVASKADAEARDTYFACASYRQAWYEDAAGKHRQRTAENVLSAKAFWLDIDCGPDKAEAGAGYADVAAAQEALGVFISTVGLPEPMTVASGGGLHVYWPLTEAVAPPAWKDVADGLKRLTQAPDLGLLADPARTSDIASILRPVGTHNYKPERAGAEVRLVTPGTPTDPTTFSSLVGATCQRFLSPDAPPRGQLQLGTVSHVPLSETPENIERVRSALAAIDPDCERPVWRDIVFALKSTRWSCAEELARAWSKGELS